MARLERITAALAGALVAACATPGLDRAPQAPDRPWHPQTNAVGEIDADAPSNKGGVETAFTLPANSAMAALPAPAPIDGARLYTLAQLVDLAQQSHPETRIAWAQARNAAIAAGIAESAYLPHLGADIVGGHQTSHGSTSVPGLEVEGHDAVNGTISALSLQWLLFDFGQRDAVREAARQVSVAADISYTAIHQRIIHEVCRTFYAFAAARTHATSARQSLKNADDIEAAAQARYQHGVGTVLEVARARQATAQARLLNVRADGGERDAYLALLSAVGISPLTDIHVADVSDRPLAPELATTADRLVSDALARRPDVLEAYALQKAGIANVSAARAEFLPKVFLAATGSYTSGRLATSALPPVGQQEPTLNLTGNHWGSTALLGISVPLYDGHLRDSMLRQAQSNADRAAASLERVRDEAVREVVAAQNGLRTSLAAYEAATALESAAHTTLDASLDAYRHDIGSVTDTSAAQTQWLQAMDSRTDAYFLALQAAVTLAFATGSLGAAPPDRP